MGNRDGSTALRFPGGSRAAILLLLLVAAPHLAACGGGGGGRGGGRAAAPSLALSDLEVPATLHAGQPARISFRILSTTPRKRVAVTLELVPLGAGGMAEAVLDPADPSYLPVETAGFTVESLDGGEERVVEATFGIDDELPPGPFAAVLRADKYDWYGSDERVPPPATAPSPRAPFAVAVHPVEVLLPDLPDLRVVSVTVEPRAFRAAESTGVGPAVSGDPETGDMEIEEDLRAAVVLATGSRPITGALSVRFELGVPDSGGGAVAWHLLDVIDRDAAGAGTDLASEHVLAPPSGSASALEEAERRGFTAHLLLPDDLREELLLREEDVVCSLRVTADPDDDHPEWLEEGVDADNVLSVPVVHLGPAGPGDPVEADSGAGPPPPSPAPGVEPGVIVQSILSGDRLDGRVRYPLQALGWGSGDRYGDPSTVAISYGIGATLTYSTSGVSAIPSGRRIALQVPSRGDFYVKADNAGGSVSTYNSWIGGWEQFTLEIASRTGSSYDVRFKAANGTSYMAVDFANYPGTSSRQVHFRYGVDASTNVFRLVDANGGELASGDSITLEWGGRPVTAMDQGLANPTGGAAVKMTIVDTDPAAVPRKAKFITDNHVNFEVFRRFLTLLKVAAAAEFDSEDVARTYFDWEVIVVGAKVFGNFVGAEAQGNTLVVKTLLDTGTKYVKSREESAKTTFWIGPVPITVEAGGKGSLGIKASVSVQVGNRLAAEAGPFLSFTAFASAGLDIGFASASLRGELTLLKIEPKFKSSIRIGVGDLTATLSLSAPFTLTTMSGRIFVRVTWNIWFWSGSQDWDIVSWGGWTKTWDLFTPQSWSW